MKADSFEGKKNTQAIDTVVVVTAVIAVCSFSVFSQRATGSKTVECWSVERQSIV